MQNLTILWIDPIFLVKSIYFNFLPYAWKVQHTHFIQENILLPMAIFHALRCPPFMGITIYEMELTAEYKICLIWKIHFVSIEKIIINFFINVSLTFMVYNYKIDLTIFHQTYIALITPWCDFTHVVKTNMGRCNIYFFTLKLSTHRNIIIRS